MRRKVLVTGNTGLLGRAVMRRLQDDFEPVPFRTDEQSITRMADCRDAVQGVWGIINLASKQEYTKALLSEMVAVNAVGAANLRKAGLEAGVEMFIQASSAMVYSDSAYGVSKKKAEEQLREISEHNLAIIRMCTLFGDKPSPQSLIADMVDSIRKGEPIVVWGKGERLYDVISTWYVAEAFVRILKQELAGTYNLSSGQSIRVKNIADSLREVSGVEIEYHLEKQESRGHLLDSSKLLERIGVIPFSLVLGFKRMLRNG
jgi:nucleoside-diphosphate-sugar epimerase